MKRFKNILVVVNDKGDSQKNPAIARGITLAQQNDACLTLMDVIPPPVGIISEYKGILKPNELMKIFVSQREKTLGLIAEQLAGDIDVRIKVMIGKDFIEIVRQVILGKHDLLIKVANDHSNNFDSSDFHLMRKCPQPVWLFKRKAKIKTRKILAAVDLELENHEEGKALNTLIMDLATSLAKLEDSELYLLSCWSLYGEDALRYSGFLKVSEDKIDTMLKQEENANFDLQHALVSRYRENKMNTHLMKGNPVTLIPNFTREKDIEVVVMGTVARSGISGLLIGNTSETILRLIDTSVITLKPKGFRSPIK